jgi:hypothetical protein
MKFLSQALKSKTVIINSLTVAVGVLGYLAGNDVIAAHPDWVAALVSIVGIVNVALRFVTFLPISAK